MAFSPWPWPWQGGAKYSKYGGLCLETQGFPNAPNEPSFPTAVLRPGEVYRHTTVYKFGVRKASEGKGVGEEEEDDDDEEEDD